MIPDHGSLPPAVMTADAFTTTLAAWIPPGSPVAIVDVPVHRNVGDLFILAASHHLLTALGCRVVYAAGVRDYSAAAARRVMTHDTILIGLGGGNFGDLYPRYQSLRERVAADFPAHRFVVLPQTLHVRDEAAFAAGSQRLAHHADLRIAARDRSSVALARRLTAYAQLLPDIVDVLGAGVVATHSAARRPSAVDISRLLASDGTLYLRRRDAERPAGAAARAYDWPDVFPRFSVRLALAAGAMVAGPSSIRARVHTAWARQAVAMLAEVVRQFQHADRVVTDRLHAAIVARMAGRPVTLVDNSYGKLRAYHDAWWRDVPSMTMTPVERS